MFAKSLRSHFIVLAIDMKFQANRKFDLESSMIDFNSAELANGARHEGKNMVTTVQITCVNKNMDALIHERITHVGGGISDRWKISLAAAIACIKSGSWQFYTSTNGKSAWVVVARNSLGQEYLRSQGDGEQINQLLILPDCP